jgi:hypothetical protein
MKIKLTEKQRLKLTVLARKQIDVLFAAISELKHNGTCPNKYKSMLFGDYADYMQYYHAIAQGDFVLANRIQDNIDTDVREAIPTTIYNLIENAIE